VKRLFILLLIGNLALAGWGYNHSQHRSVARLPASGGNLQLLSEREAALAAAKRSEQESAATDPDQSSEATSSDRGPAAASVSPAVPSLAERPPLPQPPAEHAPGSQEAKSQLPSLAQESTPSVEPEPDAQPVSEPPPAQRTQSRVLPCHSLGAFDSSEAAEAVAGQLASVGVAASLRKQPVRRASGFWVLIPPMENRDAALAMERRLREAGVEDIWRVVQGDLAHAISLGLFSRQPTAERRRKQIVALGFPAEVRPRYTDSEEYWLDFPVGGRANVQKLKRSLAREYRDIQLIQRECVRVDTP